MKTQTWLPWETASEIELNPAGALRRDMPGETLDVSVLERRTRAFPLGPDNFEPFLGASYRDVLAAVVRDLNAGNRLLCLSGGPGVGKSFLLRQLRRHFSSAFIGEVSQPGLGSLPPRIASGLGLSITGEDESAVQKCFQQFFDNARTRGRPVIQIIDDAETLKPADLAQLRRLFDPLRGQLLLVGQPEMLALFADDEVAPERIYHLSPLSESETGEYLRHRLREGGFGPEAIDAEAIHAIYDYCGGIPRLINLLCFSVLADTDFADSRLIGVERIHEAAHRRMRSGSYPFLRSPPARQETTFTISPLPFPEGPRAYFVEERREALTAGVEGKVHAVDEEIITSGQDQDAAPLPAPSSIEALNRKGPSDSRGEARQDYPSAPSVRSDRPKWMRYGVAASLVVIGGVVGFALDRAQHLLPESIGNEPVEIARLDEPLPPEPPAPIIRSPSPETATGPAVPPLAQGRGDTAPAIEEARSIPVDPSQPAPVEAQDRAGGGPSIASSHVPALVPSVGPTPPPLSGAQRQHLARLYAERAEYEKASGRWDDAEISVRRGLEFAPGDDRLRELQILLSARESRPKARPVAAAAQMHVAVPASRAVQPDLTRLYLERAQYERQNGRLRDALVSIGYGLEGDPENPALLELRARVLSELDQP